MLLLVRLFMVALSWFVGHVTWVVLFEFILTEESKQSRSCVTSVALPSVALSQYSHDSHKDEEWCKSTHQSEYDFLPRSTLYIMFNIVVVCFTFFISSRYEDRIANFVRRALNSWKSKRKAERKDALKNKTKEQQGKDIKWIKNSIVHRGKLDNLVESLKYKPNAVQTIGVYNVCFEESFVIGKGRDGTVFVGLGTDGVEVAIKRLKFEFTSELKSTSEVEKDTMNLQKLKDNPYVLKYRFHTEMEQYAYLITDLQDGNLRQFVEKSNVTELQNKGPTILRQILLGIDALHDENILHRDLKPENVLVNFEDKMVLGDFGICRQLQPDQTSHSSVMRGTEGWMAVESLPTEKDAGDPLPESEIRVRYRKKSDVQVLGMLFYFVLTKGKHPFGTPVYRMVNIIKGMSDLNDLVDADAKDLIQWMLQKKITERPTVKQCLKHPYFMSPEQKFRFLTAVGNEVQIKKKDHSSNVVRELNQNASLTTPPWWEKIDKIVLDSRGGYVNNVTDLLRFIRNLDQHFYERKAPRDKYSTPQAALLPALPELPMVVYQVVRKYPSWCEKDTLKDFF